MNLKNMYQYNKKIKSNNIIVIIRFMDKYYENIALENLTLTNNLNLNMFSKKNEKHIVGDENSLYLTDMVKTLRFTNNVLFGFYLLLIVVLVYILYNKKEIIWKAKVALVSFLLLFPFFISGFQDTLRFIYNFLFSSTTNINITTIPEYETEIKDDITLIKNGNNDFQKYQGINLQNSIFDTKIENIKRKSTMNYRNSDFYNEKTSYYKNVNMVLFIIYYSCVIGFLYELFVLNTIKVDIYVKIGIVVLLGGYPFYAGWLSKFLIYIFTMIHTSVMVKAYKDPGNEYDTTGLFSS